MGNDWGSRVREAAGAADSGARMGTQTTSAATRDTRVRKEAVAAGSGARKEYQPPPVTDWDARVREETMAAGSGARMEIQTSRTANFDMSGATAVAANSGAGTGVQMSSPTDWKQANRERFALQAFRNGSQRASAKRKIGEALFPRVQQCVPLCAGEITMRLLEHASSELIVLLQPERQLRARACEATSALRPGEPTSSATSLGTCAQNEAVAADSGTGMGVQRSSLTVGDASVREEAQWQRTAT